MARIRSVHPGFFTDDDIMNLSITARYLLLGILTECDDQGVFQWRPKTLQARIMPADNVDIELLLSELQDQNRVRRYELDGVQVGAVRNFRRWQRPKKPNSHFVITPAIRTYTALDGPSGELDDDKETPVPRKSEKSPQMKDGGGRRKEGEDSSESPSLRSTRGRPTQDITKNNAYERICAALGGFEKVQRWENLRNMVGLWLSEADLDLDILPVIAEIIAKRGGKLPENAAYFSAAIRRHAQERRDSANGTVPTAETDPDRKRARQRINAWKLSGLWLPKEWGPAPNEEGCTLPADILKELVPPGFKPEPQGAHA
ncbi:MAG: hypothetical protein GC190_20460 [Alphaproteobacteria bacterium]|nr:hypothetical protein [Alphaproteobacteria bacterium]